jgi:exonuclease VII small subunit
MTKEKKEDLTESLKALGEIVSWFEDQEEIDLEIGLEKIKKGAELVKSSKQRLSEIENEFNLIQREIEKDGEIKTPSRITTPPEDDEEEIRKEDIPF